MAADTPNTLTTTTTITIPSRSVISSAADLAPDLQANIDKIIRALLDAADPEFPLTTPRRAQFMHRVFRDWDSDKPIPPAPPTRVPRPDPWHYFVKVGTFAPVPPTYPRKGATTTGTTDAYVRARLVGANEVAYQWADGTRQVIHDLGSLTLREGWDLNYVHASACVRRDGLEKAACAQFNTAVALFRARERVAFWATIAAGEERSRSLRMCTGGEGARMVQPRLAGERIHRQVVRLREVRREYRRGAYDVAWLPEDDEEWE